MDNIISMSKGCCKACPFKDGLTEEATYAQNMGCLPHKHDIIQKFDLEGKVWACHDNEKKTCVGLKNARPSAGKPTVGETFGEW